MPTFSRTRASGMGSAPGACPAPRATRQTLIRFQGEPAARPWRWQSHSLRRIQRMASSRVPWRATSGGSHGSSSHSV